MLDKFFKEYSKIQAKSNKQAGDSSIEIKDITLHSQKEPVLKKLCSNQKCEICGLESFIDPGWRALLADELEKGYFQNIKEVLHSAPVFYPQTEKIFNFTHFSSFNNIKVVIIGQDPYHNPGQAMGLSFSVPKSVRVPPSLVNIYQELAKDIPGFIPPKHGDLTCWAKQGVLLLNDTLTVLKNQPASHSSIGWKLFTRKIIELINTRLNHVVFMLWGNNARQNAGLVDRTRHLVLEAGHPSPFSVKLFHSCRHFSQANKYLEEHSRGAIDWKVDF